MNPAFQISTDGSRTLKRNWMYPLGNSKHKFISQATGSLEVNKNYHKARIVDDKI